MFDLRKSWLNVDFKHITFDLHNGVMLCQYLPI